MSDKLDDTIAAIPTFIPGQVGQDLVVQARAWARSKGEAAKMSLELGGHLHGKDEKQRRRAVRVYLLAYQALGLDHEIGALERVRASILGASMTSVQDRLRTDIAPYVMILQDANRLRFGWSFRAPGTAEKQNQLLRAWTRVPATVRQALSALDTVRAGGRGRGRGVPAGPFSDYFGATAYLDTVKSKLGLVATMADAAILWLYYRGQNCHDPNHSDWPFVSIDKGIKPLAAVGASNRPKNREGGSAMFPLAQHRNALQESSDIHVLVGVDAEHGSNMEMQHLIIHEITHYAADTRDVKYLPMLDETVRVNGPTGQVNVLNPAKDPTDTAVSATRRHIKQNAVRTYGDALCRSMAQMHPEKAVHNADSYAYYCMQYATPW